MKKFDYDIENIINIQPKPRPTKDKRENIFNDIQGYEDTSFILNEYRNIKAESPNPERVDATAIRTAINDVPPVVGGAFNSIGVNVLKPEAIALLDFIPLYNENNVKTAALDFIGYTSAFRDYKKVQIKNVLRQIKISNAPEAIEIQNLQRAFFDKLDSTTTAIRNASQILTDKSNIIQLLRLSLTACKDFSALQEINENLASLLLDLGLTEYDFQNLNNKEIYTKVVGEVKRNVLYTSKLWDDNQYGSVELPVNENFPPFVNFPLHKAIRARRGNLSIFHLDDSQQNKSVLQALTSRIGASLESANITDIIRATRFLIMFLVNELSVSYVMGDPLLRESIATANNNTNLTTRQAADMLRDAIDSWTGTQDSTIPIMSITTTQRQDIRKRLEVLRYSNIFNDDDIPTQTYENFIEYSLLNAGQESLRVARTLNDYFNHEFLKNTIVDNQITNAAIISRIVDVRETVFYNLINKIATMYNAVFSFRSDEFNEVYEDAVRIATNRQNDNIDDVLNETELTDIVAANTTRAISVDAYTNLINMYYPQFFLLGILKNPICTKYITALFLNELVAFRNDLRTYDFEAVDAAAAVANFGDFNVNESDAATQARNRELFIHKIVTEINRLGAFRLQPGNITVITDALITKNMERLTSAIREVIGPRGRALVHVTVTGQRGGKQLNLDEALFSLMNVLLHGDENVARAQLQGASLLGLIQTFDSLFPSSASDLAFERIDRDFSRQETHYSGIDIYMIYLAVFLVIRNIATLDTAVTMESAPGGGLWVKIDKHNPQLARLLSSNFSQRKDIKNLLSPLLVQISNPYEKFINFVQYARDSIIQHRETIENRGNGFFTTGQLELMAGFATELQTLVTTHTDSLDVTLPDNFTDQLSTISVIAQKYSNLRSANALNYENDISEAERKLVRRELKSPGTGGFIINEVNLQELNNTSNFNKLLVVGIPIGFRRTLNNILLESSQEIMSFTSDLTFSKILVDIYSRDIRKTNDFALLKTSKFDLDLFFDYGTISNAWIGSAWQATSARIQDMKLWDKNAFGAENQPRQIQSNASDYAERRNEIMNHILKVYIQMLYGMRIDESQFFVDREILKIDASDSTTDAFKVRFNGIVNTLVNEQIQNRTNGANTLNKNIETLIKDSPNGVLQQYSNVIREIQSRNIASHSSTISNNDKKVLLELEETAIQIASTFKFAEQISGGSGFIKRLIAPKIFEKILIIDVPCDNNCMTDYYVKVRMNKAENVNT